MNTANFEYEHHRQRLLRKLRKVLAEVEDLITQIEYTATLHGTAMFAPDEFADTYQNRHLLRRQIAALEKGEAIPSE